MHISNLPAVMIATVICAFLLSSSVLLYRRAPHNRLWKISFGAGAATAILVLLYLQQSGH